MPVIGSAIVGNLAEGGTDFPFNGQISNLRLTDLDTPSNSRYYPSTIISATQPTTTVLVDELGDGTLTNGTLTNFPAASISDGIPLEAGEHLGQQVFSTLDYGVDLIAVRTSAVGICHVRP